jgi:predicted PhzF superfamily epimerase YddE/YHI9
MSTYIDVPIVQAFVDGERGGNPAGVVLEADRYSRAEKQAIALDRGRFQA